ncbi:beta-ketoacyl synthase [Spongiibacter sp. KMU-158]|uniref:Beta-ketoacyl synthase n=1 Tax=Spongiibacter pelagi TaxID=2760804 RepID=A0A927C3U0_9GAMM|nr:beta-ketoacyl synthase [Spongiibacter pelagi]MBD2858970.1 beta-ketoacyl synthase [Spongiibacter pelagi]
MSRLPVVVGFGGINPAGRSSFHHAYRRLVIDALPENKASATYQSLASLMGLPLQGLTAEQRQFILDHTLIRRVESSAFDVDHVAWNRRLSITGNGVPCEFVCRERDLPEALPSSWTVSALGDGQVKVQFSQSQEILLPDTRKFEVSSAGQLPTGFDPAALYASRNHPRGLQMSVFAASDALGSMGIDWDVLRNVVRPDHIGVYASSAMAQLDENGFGGLLSARDKGARVSSKQLALGLADMPADFISAYVLGNVGTTNASLGACATFFYNLRSAVQDIRNGKVRVAIVGAADAAVESRVMDGYSTMGALANDAALLKLDEALGLTEPNCRRASRPFSSNCGFTVSESAQFAVLLDDSLAMEMGAQIFGAVPDAFICADGYKKSISGPGVGNYLTVAKAVAEAAAILGDDAVRHRSLVQAHGTSTPQNRVTESHILNETAKAFGIEHWPVVAIKAYLGHSIGAASGDQFTSTLGIWNDGILPGIVTSDHIADDVHRSNLDFVLQHRDCANNLPEVAFLNAKGFGGNNATATVLSPAVSERLLVGRHGKAAWTDYLKRREAVVEQAAEYDQATSTGNINVRYRFGEGVLDAEDVSIERHQVNIKSWESPVVLPSESPYSAWLK